MTKEVGADGQSVQPLLDGSILDIQAIFYFNMVHNADAVIAQDNDLDPISRVWLSGSINYIVTKVVRLTKLAEIAIDCLSFYSRLS